MSIRAPPPFLRINSVNGLNLASENLSFTVLAAVMLNLRNDPVYIGNFYFSINAVPPFYKESKVARDFKKAFYTETIFNEWKNGQKENSISYQDFATTKIFDGYTVLRSEDDRKAVLTSEQTGRRPGKYNLVVRTDDIGILHDFLNYTSYVNKCG